MWFSRRRQNQKEDPGESSCAQELIFRLDTPSSGNVRVNFVFDSVDIIIEYKFEENGIVSSRYIIFRSVTKFSFTRIDELKVSPRDAYDAVLASDGTSEKRRRFVCFFSDHGLVEVIAKSTEKSDFPPHNYSEIFSRVPDNL